MSNENLKEPGDEVVHRMTAAEALELACRHSPQVLAQLFMSRPEPGVVFTVTMNLTFNMDVKTAQDAMLAAGFQVTIPPRHEPLPDEGSHP